MIWQYAGHHALDNHRIAALCILALELVDGGGSLQNRQRTGCFRRNVLVLFEQLDLVCIGHQQSARNFLSVRSVSTETNAGRTDVALPQIGSAQAGAIRNFYLHDARAGTQFQAKPLGCFSYESHRARHLCPFASAIHGLAKHQMPGRWKFRFAQQFQLQRGCINKKTAAVIRARIESV